MYDRDKRWRIDPKAGAQDRKTMLKLRAVGIGAPRRSKNGVPYLQFGPYNVCWFWQRGFYRLFFPVPAPTDGSLRQRFDFKSAAEVRAFLLGKEQEYAEQRRKIQGAT